MAGHSGLTNIQFLMSHVRWEDPAKGGEGGVYLLVETNICRDQVANAPKVQMSDMALSST